MPSYLSKSYPHVHYRHQWSSGKTAMSSCCHDMDQIITSRFIVPKREEIEVNIILLVVNEVKKIVKS